MPATINYLITLEAETLIDDFLSEAGKGRYIIEDDESTRIGRVVAFMRKLLGMRGRVVIRFGEPLDPFGNAVDDEGDSHDRRGRVVDPASYVKDAQRQGGRSIAARDAQYTRELGEEICRAYARDTVVMSTHVVAAACFERLRKVVAGGAISSPCSASATTSPSRATSSRRTSRALRDRAARARAARARSSLGELVRARLGRRHRRAARSAPSPATTRTPVLALAARRHRAPRHRTCSSITRTASPPTASPGT